MTERLAEIAANMETIRMAEAVITFCFLNRLVFFTIILLHEKFLQFDWLKAVVFQLNLKYLHVNITELLWVVV